jgi:hypothetical protein
LVETSIDFSPIPTVKEAASMEARLKRLERGLAESTGAVVDHTKEWKLDRLLIRPAFVFRDTDPDGDFSDRRVPPRSERPSATRISSSQGSSLALFMIAMARHQASARSGARFTNALPVRPDKGGLGWTDLFATDATPRIGKATSATVKDKKVAQIQAALDSLDRARLVQLAGKPGNVGRYEGFLLLHEAGALHPSSDPEVYASPTARELTFSLPGALVTQGWIHLLADSELALIMMIACGLGSLPLSDGYVAVPGDVRLLRYGIARDRFSASHRMLQRLGLLDVVEIDRGGDGRYLGEDAPSLHRLRLVEGGFAQPALAAVSEAFERQLARRR